MCGVSSDVELGAGGIACEENGDTYASTLLRRVHARSLRGVALVVETIEFDVFVVRNEESGEDSMKKDKEDPRGFFNPLIKSEKVNDQTCVCFFIFFYCEN